MVIDLEIISKFILIHHYTIHNLFKNPRVFLRCHVGRSVGEARVSHHIWLWYSTEPHSLVKTPSYYYAREIFSLEFLNIKGEVKLYSCILYRIPLQNIFVVTDSLSRRDVVNFFTRFFVCFSCCFFLYFISFRFDALIWSCKNILPFILTYFWMLYLFYIVLFLFYKYL